MKHLIGLFMIIPSLSFAQVKVEQNPSDAKRELEILKEARALRGHGPGNGTDGIYATYKEAAKRALNIFEIVDAKDIADLELRDFYQKHRSFLKNEMKLIAEDQSQTYLQVRTGLKAWVGGQLVSVKAATGTQPSSPVLVDREKNAIEEPIEIKIKTLLHEIGHHTGLEDEDKHEHLEPGEARFLDQLAEVLFSAANSKSPAFAASLSQPIVIEYHFTASSKLNNNNMGLAAAWAALMMMDHGVGPFPRVHQKKIKNLELHGLSNGNPRKARSVATQVDGQMVNFYGAKRNLTGSDSISIISHIFLYWGEEPLPALLDAIDLLYTLDPHEKLAREGSLDVSRHLLEGEAPLYPEQRRTLERERARIAESYGSLYSDLIKKIRQR